MSDITCREAGRKGGLTLFHRRGRSYFSEIGKLGGLETKQLHGHRYQEWGRRGGRPRKLTLKEMEVEESPLRKEVDGGRPETPPIHIAKLTPANNGQILESRKDYTTGGK